MKHELKFITLGTGVMIIALILAPLLGEGLGDANTLKANLTIENLDPNSSASGLHFLVTVPAPHFDIAGLQPFVDNVPDTAPLFISPFRITVLRC